MWTYLTGFSEIIAKPPPGIAKPLPLSINPAKISPDYTRKCKDLDYRPSIVDEVEFTEFLLAEEISLYDTDQVRKFLLAQADAALEEKRKTEPNASWLVANVEWLPLRVRDAGGGATYSKLVPERVLDIAAKIAARFPEVQFHVSHIEVFPDPFLKATYRKGRYIVAVWDEPGFSG